MDKYRKVKKPKQAQPKDDAEIRVTASGRVSDYVTYAVKQFNEKDKSQLTITAAGNAPTTAGTLAEIIKRRVKGLHQLVSLGITEIVDEYEPLEEGLDKVVDIRRVYFIQITLSKDALNTSDMGLSTAHRRGAGERVCSGRGRARAW